MHREEGLDFSRMRTFNLDEDIGLSPDHPASYHSFMEKNFFHGVNIPQGDTLIYPMDLLRSTWMNQLRADWSVSITINGFFKINPPGRKTDRKSVLGVSALIFQFLPVYPYSGSTWTVTSSKGSSEASNRSFTW